MIRFRGGDLEESAVRGEREQATLLAGNGSAVLEVPFVAHDDDRYGAGQFILGLPDTLHLLPHHVEASPVTDAVDHDDAVRPLELSLAYVPDLISTLKTEAADLSDSKLNNSLRGLWVIQMFSLTAHASECLTVS